jgi:hypothetical protein
MTIKEQITSDLSIFFNTDEFAEEITFGGVSVDAIVDVTDRDLTFGKDSHKVIILIPVSSLASAPSGREVVVVKGVTWTVYRDEDDNAYVEEDGVYLIKLVSERRHRLS